MTGSGVNCARSGFCGDVVSENDRARAIDEGMARLHLLDRNAGESLHDGNGRFDFRGGENGAEKILCDDDSFSADVSHHVFNFWMHGDREIGRNRPGRGRPNDHAEWLIRWQTEAGSFGSRNRKLYPDRRTDVIFVLDLGFRERRFKRNRPVDRLLTAVNEVLRDEARESANDIGFVSGVFRFVLRLPVSEDAQTFKLARLFLDPALRKGIAELTQFAGRYRFFLGLKFSRDLLLDGQTVAVPPGHKRCAIASHRLIPQRDIFQCLVERGADMDIAVGERRAIVKNKSSARGPFFLDCSVETNLFPMLYPRWFPANQVGSHRKVRFR